jgi:transcriptional regulator with XRE-family HTH domain
MSTLAFLLAELRRARVAAGLSQEDFGKLVNFSSSQVSAVENGQRPLTRRYLKRADEVLETGGLLERLLDLYLESSSPPWLGPWITTEVEAKELRTFESLVMPGLLQTADYARAVLRAGLYSEEELEKQVAGRLDRQSILDREDPPLLVAVVDEGMLRRPVGGAEVMGMQLEHLVEMAERPRVFVHVVPTSAGAYPGLAGPFVIATMSDASTVVYLDTFLAGQVVDRPENVSTVLRGWEALRSVALPQAQSTELIRDVAKSWTI